jgi:hypothetical protein
MNIKDYLGNTLKEGDNVVFFLGDSFQEAKILNLYRETRHTVGKNGLSYIERELVTHRTNDKDLSNRNVYAYVGWNGRFKEDFYGKPIDGTFMYEETKSVPVFNLIKIN